MPSGFMPSLSTLGGHWPENATRKGALSKTQKRGLAHALEDAGDLWDHTAVAADRTLVVSLEGGKRP